MAPQGFSGCQELSLSLSLLSLSLLPATRLHSLTQLVLSPHVFPTPTLYSLIIPPIFSSHPWTRRTSPFLIILSLCLCRFHSFSGGGGFQWRVNRKGRQSRQRHSSRTGAKHPQSVSGKLSLQALALSYTNYHILKDFSRFLFLTPTSFPLPPFHFV